MNTTFTDLARALSELEQAALREPALKDDDKLNIISDIDSLQAQLQKPEPEKSVVQSLWSGIEKTATVGGLLELVHRVAELIQPLLK